MRIHTPSLSERVIAQARIASDYHRLGYQPDSGFDANVMVRLLDQLGEMIEEFDNAALESPAP